MDWSLQDVVKASAVPASTADSIEEIIAALVARFGGGGVAAHIVLMSNGSFGGIHGKLVQALAVRRAEGG